MCAAKSEVSSEAARAPERDAEGPLLQLVYVGYVAAAQLARALPESVAYALAERLGSAAARLSRRRRKVVERNLARVTGAPPGSAGLRELTIAAYRSYARYWLETFRLARADRSFFLERFECRGIHHLDGVLRRGSGAVVVVGHLGNWDAAGAWAGASGRPMVTVAEVVRPRRLFEFFSRHRARLGIEVLPATRGVTANLVAAAAAGRPVAILGDRDLSGRGARVDFFGAPATLPLGPASVASRAGVPLLVAGVYGIRRPDGRRGWEAEISEPISPPERRSAQALGEVTAAIGRELERFIARRPEEWHVFQPFWLEDRAVPS
jgi:lauroyl/myristoyl acyltransferase